MIILSIVIRRYHKTLFLPWFDTSTCVQMAGLIE
jgi:hypothetical protein